MKSETLHVTSKTTFSELQQFADKLDDRMRLRARKVEGGYELYAKDSKPSLWSRITGRSAQTRANARDAVFSVIDRAARTHGDVKVDMARTALYSGISSKDVKGQALKALLDTVPVGTSLENRGPGLNKLPESLRKDLINHAVGCITAEFRNGNTVPDSIADKIVRDWSTDIDRAHLTADKTVLTRLGLSNGTAFVYDMRNAVAERGALKNDEKLRRIIEEAFKRIVPNLLPNKETANGEILLNGESYRPVKTLGKGGFGQVDLYECTADSNKKIALKSVLINDEDAELLKREANMHIAICGPRGHDNVVGFAGAVRMQNGSVAVALEYAPHGSAEHAKDAIDSALQAGSIDAAEAKALRLTLLKDMAAALSYLQQENRPEKNKEKKTAFTHFDVKALNLLVGEGGIGKLADFGLTDKSRKFDKLHTQISEDPIQIPPELQSLSSRRKEVETDEEGNQLRWIHDRAALKTRFKKLSDGEKNRLIANAKKGAGLHERRSAANEYDLGGADAWAFGNTAFRIFYGRELTTIDRFKLYRRIEDFGADKSNRAIDTSRLDANGQADGQPWDKRTDGAFGGSSGDANIDDLINSLLHPDPAQRMTPADALDHPALKAQDVGSPETRRKLVAVIQAYDNQQTQKAQQAQGVQQAQGAQQAQG